MESDRQAHTGLKRRSAQFPVLRPNIRILRSIAAIFRLTYKTYSTKAKASESTQYANRVVRMFLFLKMWFMLENFPSTVFSQTPHFLVS
jgi:hypothetical protein